MFSLTSVEFAYVGRCPLPEGKLETGINVLGLKDGGIDYAMDERQLAEVCRCFRNSEMESDARVTALNGSLSQIPSETRQSPPGPFPAIRFRRKSTSASRPAFGDTIEGVMSPDCLNGRVHY